MLRELAVIFSTSTRKTDFVARYGGEEFAVILPDTLIEGALLVAINTMRAMQSHKWRYAGVLPHKMITVSMGIATFPRDALLKEVLIKKADEAMYFAKRNGKNKICYFDGSSIVEYKEMEIHSA